MFGKSQEIADLQASLLSVSAERDQLSAASNDFRATIETLTTERDAAVASVAAANAAVTAAQVAADARIAEIEAAANTRIEAEVVKRLASAGTDPIAREPEGRSAEENTMKRSEFMKLSISKQNQFMRDGGKLT